MILAMGFAKAPEVNLDDITIKHLMVKSYEMGYEKGTKTANAPEQVYKSLRKDNLKSFYRTASDMILAEKSKVQN